MSFSNKHIDCNILKHEDVTDELNAKLRRLLNDPTKKQIDFQRSLSGTNSSDTDVENQLDINNQERSTKPQLSSSLRPIGIFWDIQNCRVPRGRSAAAVVQVIRNKFVNGYKEAEFIIVCDIYKENKRIIKELNDAQVKLIHVPATYKNAADEKLKQSIRSFADVHGSSAAIILISSDIDFAVDLSDVRHKKKLHVILLHNNYSSKELILCANEHYNFMKLMESLPARTPAKVFERHDLLISNLPTHKGLRSIEGRLKFLSDNCGGRIIAVNGSTAIIRFTSQYSANRAQKRMNGENVFNSIIIVTFLNDGKNRRALGNVNFPSIPYYNEMVCYHNTMYCHPPSLVIGGFFGSWHSIPPPAIMMLPVPMFENRNRHSINAGFGYNHQYPSASRGHFPNASFGHFPNASFGHFPNYCHGCSGPTCGPPHHWDDFHRVNRTHHASTKWINVPQNRGNSLSFGEGMKRIYGSRFNHSKNFNTPRFPFYGMPPAGKNSYNGVNNSQYDWPQRRSPHTGGPNHQQIRSQIILLLRELPVHKLPLFIFHVCIISEDPTTGRFISLHPDHRNTPSPFLKNISEKKQVKLPYCTVATHENKQPRINKDWAEPSINDNDKLLTIPKRDQTQEKIEIIKQFSNRVIKLLRHAPQCSILLLNNQKLLKCAKGISKVNFSF
ncbi:uncharacterized protein LOC122856530 [Aphidius gifuensis]|uniref:uncharacterized protein LOC122856530 n=1 Tax=Aphidius gifuensis TaxID=684658 RepID=UPI001CDC645D|nr:uncharacterized protein LOC122856530 [Aphidius gifuensis]